MPEAAPFGTANQESSVQAYTTNSALTKWRIPAAILVLLALSGGVYFAGLSAGSAGKVMESALPIDGSILTNGIIYEWRGSIEGNVVGRDGNSLTIQKDGNRIVIKVHDTLTTLYDLTGETPKKITIDGIPDLAFIRSEVWLPIKGKLPLTLNAGDIVARDIGIYKE